MLIINNISRWLGVLALLPAALAGAAETSVKDLETRPGVTQRFVLIKPDKPVASVILFAGGEGVLRIAPDGNIGRRGNFLVRSRARFAQEGLMVAVVDAPSDLVDGPGLSHFRQSEQHALDIAPVIAFLRKEANLPVWLVGTSRGTTSAANVAIRLQDKGPDGVVLTSSIVGNDPGRVPSMNIGVIKVPVLVVHHENDQCRLCLPGDLPALMSGLTAAPKKELIMVKGGGPVKGPPCEAFHYHGYVGIEDEVVVRITDWIKANSPPGP